MPQSLAKIIVHTVFSTKDRRPFLRDRPLRDELHRYLGGIPEGSRASRPGSLSRDLLTDEALAKIRALNEIAQARGQTLAQMALAWTLRDPRMTSALVGVSSVEQLEANLGALDRLDFDEDELAEIDRHATESDINLWAASSEE